MPTRDLSAVFDATINYPGVASKKHPEGHTYRVPSPSAEVGARLTAQAAASLKQEAGEPLTEREQQMLDLDDGDEMSFYRTTLGPVYDEMMADGVPWSTLQAVARDAFLVLTDNTQLADTYLAAAAGEAAAAASEKPAAAAKKTASSRKRTGQSSGGSRSSRGRSATPARTRDRTSTPSSTSPPGAEPEAQAKAV